MTGFARKQINNILFSDPKKYCVRHEGRVNDGEWVTSKDGLRRQFVCGNCLQSERNIKQGNPARGAAMQQDTARG
jgi:hypothetical protein